MKRFAVLWVLLSVLLTGCGQGQPSSENSYVEESNDSVEISKESDSNSVEDSSPAMEEITTDDQMVFEELTVIDNDECTIRITGIDEDNIWGYTLKVYLENKSSEKTYMFSVTGAAVNGVESDPFFAAEVAAGKKANDEINFTDSSLEENGITDFTDIELSFRVYDSNDWMADNIVEETVHVYPYGEENAMVFVRESQDCDNVIIDNEYVTAIVTGYENDIIWGYTVNLFLINKTDVEVMFSADESSVNGYMVDPFYATSVMPGKSKFSSISWLNTTLEENGITEVEEIEFLFRVYNSEDWLADDFVNEVITLNP